MARKPTRSLDEQIAELEERLKLKKQQRAEKTKAEEGKLKENFIKEIQNLIPNTSWEELPKIISEKLELAIVAEGLSEVIEGKPNKEEVKGILLDWISERKTNNSTFKRHYKTIL